MFCALFTFVVNHCFALCSRREYSHCESRVRYLYYARHFLPRTFFMLFPESRRLKYSQPAPDTLDWRMVAALAFTLILWSSAFAAIRFCLRPGAYNPGHLALLRFLVASLTMLLCCVFVKVRPPDMRDAYEQWSACACETNTVPGADRASRWTSAGGK